MGRIPCIYHVYDHLAADASSVSPTHPPKENFLQVPESSSKKNAWRRARQRPRRGGRLHALWSTRLRPTSSRPPASTTTTSSSFSGRGKRKPALPSPEKSLGMSPTVSDWSSTSPASTTTKSSPRFSSSGKGSRKPALPEPLLSPC